MLPIQALAASVTLAWDPSTEPALAGYKMYYGFTSRTYTTSIDVGNVVTRTVVNLLDGRNYCFAVTAYDSHKNESGYSNEVCLVTRSTPAETISAPSAPSGPATGTNGVAYTYTTGGAVSSTGDPVQYRFSWADGTVSNWLPAASASAAKIWSAPNIYTTVRAEARCAFHQTIVSTPSRPITVTITSGTIEKITSPSAPFGPATGKTSTPYMFSTGSAVSSKGDPVKYRFHWGDGSVSDWIQGGQQFAEVT